MQRDATGSLEKIAAGEYTSHFEALPHIFLVGDLRRACPHPFFRDSRLEVIACQYEAGSRGEFHWHPVVTEYEYVIEGSLSYREAETGTVTLFRAGDLATVPVERCVERVVMERCRTLAIKVPSNDVRIHCRDCSRVCARRVQPFEESA